MAWEPDAVRVVNDLVGAVCAHTGDVAVSGAGGRSWGGVNGTGALLSTQRQRLMSLLVGQGVATLGLELYALLIGPLEPYDGVGEFLCPGCSSG